MESHIWAFRARAGPYRESTDENDKTAENLLTKSIEDTKASVFEGADVKSTSFYGQNKSLNLHNQHYYKKPGGFGKSEKMWQGNKTVAEDEESEDEDDDEDTINEEAFKAALSKAGVSKASEGDGIGSIVNVVKNAKDNVSNYINSESEESKAEKGENKKSFLPLQRYDELELRRRAWEKDPKENKFKSTLFHAYCRYGLKNERKKIDEFKELNFNELIKFLQQNDSDNKRVSRKNMHYEPLQPDTYIEYRLETELEKFQMKIPNSTYFLHVCQVILILSTIASGALAYFQLSTWCAGVSIVTAAVGGYMEFDGTSGKVDRYSSSVDSIQKLILWWRTLTPIDKTQPNNIDRLVCTGEDILAREQQALSSSSHAIKMLELSSSSKLNVKAEIVDQVKKSI